MSVRSKPNRFRIWLLISNSPALLPTWKNEFPRNLVEHIRSDKSRNLSYMLLIGRIWMHPQFKFLAMADFQALQDPNTQIWL